MSEPACPRCGYDQSGAIAAWERTQPPQCPLSGLCTECGLQFAWRDLLNPEFARQDRYYEHAQRRVLLAFVRTLWAALRPWALWRSVRMEHAMVRSRIALFVLTACLLTALAAGLIARRCEWAYVRAELALLGNGMGPNWSDDMAFRRLTEWPATLWDNASGIPPWSAGPHAAAISPQVVVALLAFVLSPAAFALLPVTLRRAQVRPRHLLRIVAYGAPSFPLVLTAPLVLAAIMGLVMCLDVQLHGNGYRLRGLGVWWERHRWAPALGCAGAWLGVWWTLAAGRYLRLPHAVGIGVTIALLAGLLALGLIMLVPGGARWMLWGL